MIHGDSGREGGISRFNGTGHVFFFAHLETLLKPSKHPKFKSRATPASPGIKRRFLKKKMCVNTSEYKKSVFKEESKQKNST